MALFDFRKNKHHFVQSFESPENDGIRIYFNGENEKKSNTNMLYYLGDNEYQKIKLDPIKYKYIKEEITETQLKSIGINPNTTGHKIYTGPQEIKNDLKSFINLKKEINNLETKEKTKVTTNPSVTEEIKSSFDGLKIESKSNDKEIKINVTDDHGNKSKTNGTISKSGKEIHIHINLGSSPHIEKAMIENQEAIKKLQNQFAQSLQEAKDTIKKMEEKFKEKNLEPKNNLSSNFESLTRNQKLSRAESAFQKEIFFNHEPQNVHSISQLKKEENVILNKNEEEIPEKPSEIKKEEQLKLVSYTDALNLSKKEDSIYFRGKYNKRDNVDGHSYEQISKISPQILKENYDRKIYSHEENGLYSIIKNIGANKIQNYVIEKENIDKIILDPETPKGLKDALERYNSKEIEAKPMKSIENEKSVEM